MIGCLEDATFSMRSRCCGYQWLVYQKLLRIGALTTKSQEFAMKMNSSSTEANVSLLIENQKDIPSKYV